MAHISVHSVSSEQLERGPRLDASPSPVAAIIQRLSRDLSGPPAVVREQPAETPAAETDALPAANSVPSIAFLSRCIVLQSIGVAGIAALWISGLAGKPFEASAVLPALILGIGLIGVVCVFLQRWRDVQWIATHVVRIGLLGTVVGLIAAFSSVHGGGSNDPNQIREMIAAVVDGMYVSLYATLLGIGCNLWLKVNLRLLGNFHG